MPDKDRILIHLECVQDEHGRRCWNWKLQSGTIIFASGQTEYRCDAWATIDEEIGEFRSDFVAER